MENKFIPKGELVRIEAVAERIAPWIQTHQPLPSLSVLELARLTDCSQQRVITLVLGDTSIKLEDRHGGIVNGNLRTAALDSAPHQRVAKRTQSKGRPYEELVYEMGIGRLQLKFH